MYRPLVLIVAFGWCLCLLPETAARGDDASARFYEGLRQRRLFGLAEGELLERLADGRLSSRRRTDLTIELARTFVEHARFASADEQADLWQRAASAVDQLLQADPQNPWRPLLELQRALVPAARAEFLSAQAELSPFDRELADRMQAAFRDATARLRTVAESLDVQLRRATAARRATSEGITPYELRTLLYETRYRLGAALLAQAGMLPTDSPDRAAALIDAESWLKQVAGGPPGEPLTWNGQLLLAQASRLRGDVKHAERLLVQVENDEPPRDVADRVTAERVRLLLATGRAPDAVELLAEYRRRHAAVPGELQFLNVEALAALHEIALARGDRDLSKKLLATLESFVAEAVRGPAAGDGAGRGRGLGGGYWGYRSQLLLETVRDSERHGPALAALIRQARTLYAGGRIDEALAAYEAAQAAAMQTGQSQTAFELGYTRASIELETGLNAQAARSFLTLADAFPSAAQTPDAHLLAAWCLGRVYEQSPTRENRLAYTQALTAHRERFPQSPTFHDAGWMLGLLEERRLQATAALKLYRTIPADHRRGGPAQAAVARCHEAILDRLAEVLRNTAESGRKQEVRDLRERSEQEALGELGAFVSGFPQGPAALSVGQAEVCVRLARLLLSLRVPDYARADHLLERVFHSSETAPTSTQPAADESAAADPAAWKPLLRTAAQLRIVSLAGQGEFQKAEALVRSLSGSRAADVLAILNGLGELARDTGENTRFHVGQLQLRAAAELDRRRGELSAAEQQQLDLCLAEAFVAGGQSRDGIAYYERVLAAQPGNHDVRRRLAEVLEEACGTRECLDKARRHWRSLESSATPGTPDWMTARYHVARCTQRLGERDEARKLVAITKLLYPDLGGETLEPRFEELERELELDERR